MDDRVICDVPEEPWRDVSGRNSVVSSPRKRRPVEEDIIDDPLLRTDIAFAPQISPPVVTDAQRLDDLRQFVIDTMTSTGIVSAVKGNQEELSSLKIDQDSTVQNANVLVGDLSRLLQQFKQEIIAHDHRLSDHSQQTEMKLSMSENRSMNRDNTVLLGQRSSDERIILIQNTIQEQQRQLDQLSAVRATTTDTCQNRVSDIVVDSWMPRPPVIPTSLHDPPVMQQNTLINHSTEQQIGGVQPGFNIPDERDTRMFQNESIDRRQFSGGRRPADVYRGIPPINTAPEGGATKVGGGSLKCPALSNTRINPPPMFDQTKFLAWKRDVLFWRDIYWYIEDSQLMSVLSLNASPVLKKFLMTFLRRTREQPDQRTLKNVIDILQKQFAASIKEREMAYLDEMLTLKRESAELIQAFWYRYEELVLHLEGHAIQLPENMLFLRLLRALNVPNQVRLSIITRIDCQGMLHDVKNLKRVSIELLGVYRDVLNKSEGQALMGDYIQMEDALVSAKHKLVKKPGMEVRSVRASIAASNFPNPTGKGTSGSMPSFICFRCGAKDHLLKDCPKTYTAQLMFAPKKGDSKGQKGKRTFLIEEQSMGEEIQIAQEESLGEGRDEECSGTVEGEENNDVDSAEGVDTGESGIYSVDDIEWVEGWLGDAAFMVEEQFPSFRYESDAI